GGNEEMNGHAAWDMWGLSRAYVAGKYGMTQPLLRPFAETLRYIIYQAGTTYTFAEWVNGDTSTTRNYIYAQWMGVAAHDPQIFATMANADISQGSQGSTPIYDAQILWVKNARARGFFASNTDTPDFSLTTPWVENLTSGSSSNFPVTVNSLAGFAASGVTLSMSGLPGGVTASFSSPPNSTLTLTASGSAASGVYAATISGTGSGLTRTAPVTLVITNLAVSNFSMTTTPSSQNIVIGGNTSYSVTVVSLNGFSGMVALSVSGLPAHASGSFNPASITGGAGSSTLNITTATNTPNGDYPLIITGISGTLTNTTSVTLSFNDFSISASPSSQSVIAGGTTNYTVNVGNINGFGGTVTFSAAGLPTGAGASFNPTSVSLLGSSTMTVTTATNTPAGTNAVTITGVSAGLQHSATVSLVVQAASGGGSTNNLALNQTATASTTWSASYAASNAVDGNTSTRWSAASGQTNNQWLLVDFGTATTYSSVVIKEISFQRVTAFKIQSSTDGTTFTDLATGTTIGTNLTVTFSTVSARYVRLFVTSASNVPTINEFEVYGGGSGGGTVAAPTFSPAGGTYTSAQAVTISTATGGASIRYTIDGSTPTETAGTLYSSPVNISATTTLKAIAYESGMTDSSVTSATYTISSGDSNIAPGGTAYGWKANTSATANSNRTAQSGLNDNNLTVDVDIDSAGDAVNAWEAAGVTWSSTKTISSANFINGTVTSGGDGFLTANCKLQFSTDGSTWVDSGWTISPAYPNSSAASGQTYSFSGTAVSGKLGARVVGQVRTTDTSYHWIVKEVRFIGH
ncbi:MAG TPA: discoidin domain-containing protein, partial [Candidatus Acidoferrales bacterium]|nr:discoidin domain-containing protein [Candidatus Acidoferrales bacterium]